MKEYRTSTLPFDKLTANEQLGEIFYKRALELTKAAYMAINRSYPESERKASPKVEYRYAEAHRTAKQHLNFFKKNVADFTRQFCDVRLHKGVYDFSQDRSTKDYRIVVSQQFDWLYGKFVEYAEILVPDEDVDSFLRSLEKVYTNERELLLNSESPTGILSYEIIPVVRKEHCDEITGVKLQTIHHRTRRPISDVAVEFKKEHGIE